MNPGEEGQGTTFSCRACAYASPLRSPFTEWIWCGYPSDGQLLNLARDADCRRASGGRSRARDAAQAPAAESDQPPD